ncbi:ATP-dependent RNA helicase RhlE [Filimonas zeae]|uniref:ATP-dependent RNA helicase RhlE n=1 Tax=Filimonas zeae TaxID=1737353 RepID=A0A917MWJ0_9BACT|nr:DEAD/DEAH box helicase [Filimonas zeae]MDR6339984.1 ATP-dependent RNA helicase RhlE [Filimonas zeae]GGH70579.1 ATP-dependent RNA helicase RhlE [Filimonas zeae]
MKFEQYNISEAIKARLAELEFKRPTDIQFKAIPPILKGDDVLAIAQTGTGKTAAFAIPLLHLLDDDRLNRVYKYQVKCLVMVPTRELAVQIAGAFREIGKHLRLNIIGIFGGVEQEAQIKQLEKGADVVIATPGRMFDLIHQEKMDLSQLRTLVLDEADHMLDLGFIKDIRDVLRHIRHPHQTLFFSATINTEIKEIAYSLVRNPIRIQISPQDPVSKNVSHAVAYIEMDDKRFFLERIAKEFPDSKMLVFVRTKVRAERVAAAMERVGIATLTMHGGKEQRDRLQVMNEFKNGDVKILITTDVNARGIDIPNVDYVVNYDLPDEPENYVHRVGRTGRGVQKGQAVSFCSTEEKPVLAAIQKYLGKPIEEMQIEKSDYKQTIRFSEEVPNDNWKLLLEEDAKAAEKARKKKKK